LLLFYFYFQPENILLDDNLNIKLSDFGFATVLGPEEELTGRSYHRLIEYLVCMYLLYDTLNISMSPDSLSQNFVHATPPAF